MEEMEQGMARVLVIEDSGNRPGEIDCLLHHGCRADNARDFAEAAAMAETAMTVGDPYVVALLDAANTSGPDAALAADLLWVSDPHIEVVIFLACSDSAWERMAEENSRAGRLFYIRKPFDSTSARQIIRILIQKWRLSQQIRSFEARLDSEVRQRTRELDAIVLRLTADLDMRRDKEFQLAHYAHYDMMTGLLNRHSFYEFIGEFVGGHQTEDRLTACSLLFIGMDGFKKVNERWGRDMGDRLLSEIAARIRESAEAYAYRLDAAVAVLADPDPESAIFRMGGDEFTLLADCSGREEAWDLSEQVLQAISRPYVLREQEISISCSIGVSRLHADASDFVTLLNHADMAMHKAKEKGGSIVFHDQLRGTGWLDPVNLAADLNTAMEENQMEVFYQRIVDMGNRLTGMSALIRWRHPRFGIILPDDFLPVSERLSILPALERRTLRMACRQLASLSALEYSRLFVLVHSSAGLFFDAGFEESVRRTLFESGLSPKRLMIVLRESTLQRDTERALEIIRSMTDSGVRFAVECAGISQMLHKLLRVLPLETVIQIDRNLLAGITRKTSDRLFLQNMLNLMQERAFTVLVGGVETSGQEEFLRGRDCLRQGFLYGAPVPFDEFVQGLGSGGLHHMENM